MSGCGYAVLLGDNNRTNRADNAVCQTAFGTGCSLARNSLFGMTESCYSTVSVLIAAGGAYVCGITLCGTGRSSYG